jgi:RNA 2',3'-cyclic 3'-phosphodiesterase
MDQFRLFFGIELSENIKYYLEAFEKSLKSVCSPSVKWVNPDNIHLTLKFLGNVELRKIDSIIIAAEKAVLGVSPFQLKLSGVGVFPDLNNIQVIWTGLEGELDKLRGIQSKLETELNILGFPYDKRRFQAHLTLARVSEKTKYAEKQILSDMISEAKIAGDISFKVDSISLIQSFLTRTGAIYNRLSEIKMESSCQ